MIAGGGGASFLSPGPLSVVGLFLFAVNGATIMLFRHDKQAALGGRERVPERRLLQLAMIGGTPAAFVARRLFRHKTRKQPFSRRLMTIASVQALAVIVSAVLVRG